MWVRRLLAIALLALFVLSFFGMAEARKNPSGPLPPSRDSGPPGTDPNAHPWGENPSIGGDVQTTIIIRGPVSHMIPIQVAVEGVKAEKIMPLLKAKRGK